MTDLSLQIATSPAPGCTGLAFSFDAGRSPSKHDAIVIPIRCDANLGPISIQRLRSFLGKDLDEFLVPAAKTALKSSPLVLFKNSTRIILQPINEKAGDPMTDLRSAFHDSLQTAAKTGAKSVSVLVPGARSGDTEIDALIRTAVLSQHSFDRHLTEKPPRLSEICFVDLLGDDIEASSQRTKQYTARVNTQQTIAEGTILARELSNARADIVTPEYIEQLVESMTAAMPNGVLRCRTIKGVDDLRENGMSMMAAVGQGAVVPPRLVIIEYIPGVENTNQPIGLVGKGITFDSGGLNLKPTGSMEDMHMDMSGAAAVIGAMRSIALLRPNQPVVAALALAENAIGSRSYKPHTILPSAKGSVMVSNTDAEGRLCLADAMTYIQEHHKPSVMIDMATLTGACIVALGEYAAGVFTHDDELANSLVSYGNRAFERCWRMPILPEHVEELKGLQSDMVTCGKGRSGGACTAAAFLSKFVNEGTRWAHVDIAGPAMYSRSIGHIPQGGTGFGAQLLADFVLKHPL